MVANPNSPDPGRERLYARIEKVLADLKFLEDADLEQPEFGTLKKFRERAPRQQLNELEAEHQKGLDNRSDYFGLPLTLDKYKKWRELHKGSATDISSDSYRGKAAQLEAYETLKTIHGLRDENRIANADEEIERLLDRLMTRKPGDQLVIQQPDLLCDGMLAYFENEAINFMAVAARAERRDWALKQMHDCIGQIQVNTVVWNARMSILSAWSQDKIVEMWDEIVRLKTIVQAAPANTPVQGNALGWEKFRLQQTADDQPTGSGFLAKCLPALVARLDRAINDARLALAAPNPSSEKLTSGLQHIIILREIQQKAASFVQNINAAAAGVVFDQLVDQLPQILAYLHVQLERDVIAQLPQVPLQYLVTTVKSLASAAKRIRPGVAGVQSVPSPTLQALTKLEEDAATALKHMEQLETLYNEMREVLRKILVADPAVVGGQTTWNFGMFDLAKGNADLVVQQIPGGFPGATNRFANMGQAFDCRSIRDLVQQKTRIEAFINGADPQKESIARSIAAIRDYLSRNKRTQTNPRICYERAAENLDRIDELAKSISDVTKSLFDDSTDFRIPGEFMVSPVEFVIEGKYVNSFRGFEEHRDMVNKLLERARSWDEWRKEVVAALHEVTRDGHYDAIHAWNEYADSLPYSPAPWQHLSEDHDGWAESAITAHRPDSNAKTTDEIVRYLREEDGSPDRAFIIPIKALPSAGLNEPPDVYNLYALGNRLRIAVEAAKSAPSKVMLGDLVEYHSQLVTGDEERMAVALGMLRFDSETKFVTAVEAHVESKMTEIFQECCKADYVAHRFLGYANALSNDLTDLQNVHHPWYQPAAQVQHAARIRLLEKQIALLKNGS